MKLSDVNYNVLKDRVLMEGYGRVVNTSYSHPQVDPRPDVLVLGRWKHPNTGNLLVCGTNLHYLSDDQILRLRKNLPAILADKNLRRRVRTLRRLMPDVFDRSYRTYRADRINIISKGTLKFYREPKPDIIKKTKEEPLVKMKKPTGKIDGLADRIKGISEPVAAPEIPGKPKEMDKEGGIKGSKLSGVDKKDYDKLEKLSGKDDEMDIDKEDEVDVEDDGDEGDEILDGGLQ